MADTTTTNLLLTKPEVGASTDSWGTKLNTDLDTIDGVFAAAGTGTSVGLNIGSGKSLKLVGNVIDTNGNELLKVSATASAVNEVTLANAATGGTPTFTASGDDTNIGMKLVSKGTGEITAKVNGSDVFNASSSFGFKNRIINGAMMIDQRNAGASVSGNAYPVDRFQVIVSQSAKLTAQQNAGSVTPPTGFVNYLGVTSSSAYSITAGDYFAIRQFIEGFNIADLGWGTANAKTVTLSFQVYSSLTGTFGGALQNSSQARSYPFSYTISSANTWTPISVTIAGDTSGTWLTTNGQGIGLYFGIGVGSTSSGTAGSWAGANYLSATGATSVVGTNGATFYITGVQLEKGSTATSFDYRPYGTELQLAQRYTYVASGASGDRIGLGYCASTTLAQVGIYFPATMRAAPSISGTSSQISVNDGAAQYNSSAVSLNGSTVNFAAIQVTTSGMTAGRGAQAYWTNANSSIVLSAEL